ncbi:MAG: hypothetical protein CMH57_10400 [Myxococcales bacterium]|nr:hypothetical protein [Myxococcales bacterium]
MLQTPLRAALLALMFLIPSWAAEAQVQYRLATKVPEGQKPRVTIVAQESLEQVELVVKRSDGKAHRFKRKNVLRGAEIEVPLPQSTGSFAYSATLTFKTVTGQVGEANFEFEAAVAPALEIKLRRDRSSLDQKQIVLTANAPVKLGEIEVFGEGGAILASESVELGGVAPGGDLVLGWSGADASIERIAVKIHDQLGFWQTLELVPFTVNIPHKEVNFDSGKASFGASEAQKLEETYALLSEQLAKHGSDLEIRLYIAGYTDTVGAAQSNIALSTARARAIASWFRKRGITIPIFYQGFGESVLLVKTADNVDEPRNRRALYILGNQQPPSSDQLPRKDWKPLR